mmetsp:Transcript_28266/g.71133  ORF Transcript_28266/g.71133 Transcript_28266/m.71133 type:complete len:121 (+) Transcript_28266:87-449(+)
MTWSIHCRNIRKFQHGADADPLSLPLETEPLAERPLATEDSTSGITCTSAMQEAISEGVARFPSRSERSLTRAYWYLLKFAYCSTLRACPKDEFCQLSDGLKSLVYARWRKAFHVFGCSP